MTTQTTSRTGRRSATFTVTREDDLDFRSAEYRDVFSRSTATAFQHPVWLATVYDVLAPRRSASRRVLTIRDEHGRLVGVVPLIRRRRFGLRIVEYADLGVNDYAAPVLDADATASLLADRDLVKDLRRALGGFDLLRIERLPGAANQLATLLGGRVKPHLYGTHPIALPATTTAWREQLPAGTRRNLERKYKRLRPKGEHRLRLVTDPDEAEQLLEQLRIFRAARFGERGGIDLMQQPDYFAFYLAIAQNQDAESPHRLAVLEVAGEPAAIVLGLDDGTSELFMLVGYDISRLRNCSLGLLIVDQLAQAAIERGRTCFDLTVGDEPYKDEFGASADPLYEVRAAGTPWGAAALVGQDAYLRLRRAAKRRRDAWQLWRQAREAGAR